VVHTGSNTELPSGVDTLPCPHPVIAFQAEREERAQRILIVDDGGVSADTVQSQLEDNGYEVLIAKDAQMTLRMLRCERPDLVLVDLMSPDVAKTDALRDTCARADLVAMPLITLTACSDQIAKDGPCGSDLNTDMGQPGTTRFDPSQVVACIQHLLRHAQLEATPPRAIRAGPLTIDLETNQVKIGRTPVHLTHTEFSLLHALAAQPGRALTRSDLIRDGLEGSYQGMERTVDSHIKNLRRKLDDACGAAYLVETVFGIGYRLAEGEAV
jgi:two-component system alkaline phosphatase synthesis response regulator PhoP